jgi:hypothetical protein
MISTPPPEPAKPASRTGEMKVAKTEMMPGLSKEEALRLAKAAVSGGEAPRPDDIKGKKTEMISTPPQEPAKPASRTGEMKVAKTEMMPGLSKEEALRLAKAAVSGGEAPKPDDLKGKKTEMISTPPPEPAKPASRTGEMKVAKTEMMPGMTKEEALKIAKAAVAGEKPETDDLKGKKTEVMGAAPPARTGEMKVAKTEAMPGLSKEEALRIAGAATPAADAKKTGSKVALKKTGEMAAPKADVQALKTEAMPGLTRAEAEAQVRGDMQVAKTQALDGMSAAEAKKIAGEAGASAAKVAPRPAPASIPKELDAELRRSPVPLFAGAVALLLLAALLIWQGPQWFGGGGKTRTQESPSDRAPHATSGNGKGESAAGTGGKTGAQEAAPPPAATAATLEEAARRLQAAALDAIEEVEPSPAGR